MKKIVRNPKKFQGGFAALVGAATAVYGAYEGSKKKGSSNGGSDGGNAPAAYVPTNQAGMDASFQNNYNNYQNANAGYYGVTGPMNDTILQNQYNNPTRALTEGAQNADTIYTQNAQQAAPNANYMYLNAANTATLGNKLQGTYGQNSGSVQNATTGMFNMANDSTNQYNGLIGYQQGQQGNVNNASGQQYAAGSQAYNTAFDPNGAQYQKNKEQLTDNVRAAEYARGIQSSPLGASVEANALGQFQNDWQTQQVGRQATGINTMNAANQGAQGLTSNYLAGNSGLIDSRNQNYTGLNEAATSNMSGWLQSQANTSKTMSGAIAQDYQTAMGIGNTAAQMYAQGGQQAYNARNTAYGNQDQAIQSYYGNNQPYMSGLNQSQSNALGYMNQGTGAQSTAFGQNNTNAANQNMYGQQMGSSISSLGKNIQSIYNNWGSGSGSGSSSSTDSGGTYFSGDSGGDGGSYSSDGGGGW